jgi:3',5'-cyclic-AMP phosphodiesterase
MTTIAYVSDIHLAEDFPKENGVNAQQNWERILADIWSRQITHIIFGGDIGSAAAHPYFFKSLETFQLQLVLGNHDTFEEVAKTHQNSLVASRHQWHYVNDDTPYKQIFLDTSTDSISASQLAWLQQQLVTDKSILLFMHHPVLEVDTPVDRMFPLKERAQVEEMMARLPNRVHIFCGHYHMDDVRQQGNIIQTITPAASYQIEKEAAEIKINTQTFGYRILTITDDDVTTELVLLRND